MRNFFFYQRIENGNLGNQIHGFTGDYGKLIVMGFTRQESCYLSHFDHSLGKEFKWTSGVVSNKTLEVYTILHEANISCGC